MSFAIRDAMSAREAARDAMKSRILTFMFLAASGLVAAGAAGAPPAYVPGELIVKFRPGVPATLKAALVPGTQVRAFRSIGAEKWKIDDRTTVDAAVKALTADPSVEYAEPNYLLYKLDTPDDPYFDQLWGLHNTGQVFGGVAGTPGADIDAVAAWDVFTGSSSVTVAVIDTGVDYTHPDLAPNIWNNSGEIAGNGVDDDANGFIDDIHGWDFQNNDNDPMDDNSHGTHCAGTIGAAGDNGLGVAGVNWNVRIMPLKFLNSSGVGATDAAISCIEYATSMGVDVMSNSWGSGAYSASLQAAIQAAYVADIFFVAAAGNAGNDNDLMPNYPSNYEVGNIIAVMATDNRDQRADEYAWSSNFGAATVDIAAPGVRIWSTIRNGSYMYLSGTSMATPCVAGALALLRGRFPDISVDRGRYLLLGVGNDPSPSLDGLCVSGGRLNLRKLIADPNVIPPAAITDLAVLAVASNWLELEWTVPADDGALAAYDVRRASSPIVSEADWVAATPASDPPAPGPAGTSQSMRVDHLPVSTTWHFCVRTKDEYGNLSGLSNSATGATLAAPTVAVSPLSLQTVLPPGGVVTRTLTISNPGVGVLDFRIPHNGQAVPAADGRLAGIQGAGGPDAYGYDWIDSDAPGGPAFEWVDITTKGTAVTLTGDSNQGPFDIGFTFPYYGGEFTTFAVSTHGCVSLSSGWTTGANVALPSKNASGNLLALLWDQMTTGVGTCRYYNDGTRLIVQYNNVNNVGAGGPYTMQMRLYPGGIIEYCYLTVTAPSSGGATVGIQNGDGTDGLTVACNAAYVHDNLEIRISPPAIWLNVDPPSGSVAAGASLDVDVTFDTAGLCGDSFDANLHVLSNDPSHPDVIVPAQLDLEGTPDQSVTPPDLAFGAIRLGDRATLSLSVANHGCAHLTLSALTFDNSGFSSSQALPLEIPAGITIDVPVTFAPLAPVAYNATLTIVSDDPDVPALLIPLSGTGLFAPDIALDIAELSEILPPSGTVTRQMTVTNNGLNTLTYSIPAAQYVQVTDQTADSGMDSLHGTATDMAAVRDTTSVGTFGAGGPDAYGYRWSDSDATRGPAYNWIEIATNGTVIPFNSTFQNMGPYPIGFSFPFYGKSFTTFQVCVHGWISFTATTKESSNLNLPSTSAPANIIAPYWDSMNYEGIGSVYYRNDGQRLIVEFKNVIRSVSSGYCSFQIHLYPSGRIEYHYQTMPETLDSATVGIQNASRSTGLTVAHNSRYVHSNLAVRFDGHPAWLAATPISGTLGAGASATVSLALDASGLCGSTNLANLHVLSNDPDSPDLLVPVRLDVLSGADPRISPAIMNIGDVYVANSVGKSMNLANIGCAALQVTGATIDNPVFTVDVAAPFSVAAGASRTFNVALVPVAAGPVTGNLLLTTDSPVWPTISIPLTGSGIYPGIVGVTPSAVATTVQPGKRRTETFRLANTGSGALTFSIVQELTDKDAGAVVDSALGAGAGQDPVGGEPRAIALGGGGPDMAGYRWIDSDAATGPAFSWIEIAGTGAAVITTGTNGYYGPIILGASVPYYAGQYNYIYVTTDGWINVGSGNYNSSSQNANLPCSSVGSNFVGAFWDDLDLSVAGSGDIWYKKVDGNWVVEWDHVMRHGTTTPVTFEIIITPQGAITFQYLSFGGALTNSATVGIQNDTFTMAVPIVYNAPYLHENLAILFWRPRWATVSMLTGSVPAGGAVDVSVEFNAIGVPQGVHHGQLRIQTNDVTQPTVLVPLTMNVVDYVSAAVVPAPDALAMPQNVPNPFNPSTRIHFALPEKGAVDLRVYDLRGALIRTLTIGELPAGYHDYIWDGRSDTGADSPSGVYFYRLRTDSGEITRRMTLVK